MKNKIKWFVGAFLVLSIVFYFFPTKAVPSASESELAFVYHHKDSLGKILELDEKSQKDILTYLSTCKLYRTLYFTEQNAGSNLEYYGITVQLNGKQVSINITDTVRATKDDSAMIFGMLNATQAKKELVRLIEQGIISNEY